jgi:hypothetical protein
MIHRSPSIKKNIGARFQEDLHNLFTYTSSWAGDENNIIEDIEFF